MAGEALRRTNSPPVPPADDGAAFAIQLANTFRRMVGAYERNGAASRAEAAEKASSALSEPERETLDGPPDQVSWSGLTGLASQDPEQAQRRWEEIKQAARDVIASGHEAMQAIEGPDATCWARALYLAVRDQLIAAWRPRDGQEMQLVEMLAQARLMVWSWQQCLMGHFYLANADLKRTMEKGSRYCGRVLSHAEETEEAMSMVERWHALYLRTLKALQGLRRGQAGITIRGAGQVNLAATQTIVNS